MYKMRGDKGGYAPQLRHTSAAHFIPTLEPMTGFITPGPCSMTSPMPIERTLIAVSFRIASLYTFMSSDLA